MVTPQLSIEPLLISEVVTDTVPPKPSVRAMLWQTALGLVVSLTLTVAVQVAALPAASLTRIVTVLTPVSPQPKLTELAKLGSVASTLPLAILYSVMAQLSLDPLFTSAALTLTVPGKPALR